jgi:hypothetical protein
MSIEDQIKDAIATHKVEISPDALNRIDGIIRSRERTSKVARFGVVVAAFVLGALGVGLLVFALKEGGSTPGGHAPTEVTADTRVTLDIGPVASSVVAASGDAWVVQPERALDATCNGAVVRIRSGNSSQQVIGVDGIPLDLAIGGSSVWVSQLDCGEADSGRIVQLDEASGDEVGTSQPIRGLPTLVSATSERVWSFWRTTQGTGGDLVVQDLTGTTLSTSRLEDEPQELVATGSGAWVLVSGVGETTLIHLSSTGQPNDRRTLDEGAAGLVAYPSGIWVGTSTGLLKIDETSQSQFATPGFVGPAPIGADAEGVWFLAAVSTGPGRVLGHLAAETGKVDLFVDAGEATRGALDQSELLVWLTAENGAVRGITVG